MKCARTACNAVGTQLHRDLPGLYCRACAHKINRANGVALVSTAPSGEVTAEALTNERIREWADSKLEPTDVLSSAGCGDPHAMSLVQRARVQMRDDAIDGTEPLRGRARPRIAAAINARKVGR